MSNQTSRIYKSAYDTLEDNKFYKLAANGELSGDITQLNAGIVTVDDIADIKSLTVLNEVLGLARPQYSLNQACRVVPTDTLELTIDVATKLSAQEKVPELVEPDLKKQGYSTVTFDLWKNAVHVAVGGKASRQARRNVMMMSIEDAAGALANSKNSQITTAIESTSATGAGANWKSTDNPYDDINTGIASIEDTYGFRADTMVAPRAVWSAFFGNSFVKGQLAGQVMPSGNVFSIPGLPGMKGIRDQSLTAASMTILDSRNAVFLAQGPVEAEAYRNSAADYDAWVIRDWMQPKLVQNGAAYKLTALLT
jgi:hypothetical protein